MCLCLCWTIMYLSTYLFMYQSLYLFLYLTILKSLESCWHDKFPLNRFISIFHFSFYFFNLFFFICSEFCHTLEWNSHGFTCVPHPDPPSHLPLHPLPLGFPNAPGPSACLMHPTWAGDLFHPRYYTCFDAVLLKHPTLAFSHRV